MGGAGAVVHEPSCETLRGWWAGRGRTGERAGGFEHGAERPWAAFPRRWSLTQEEREAAQAWVEGKGRHLKRPAPLRGRQHPQDFGEGWEQRAGRQVPVRS